MKIKITVIDKIIIAIYLVIVVVMLLNPPWAYFHPESGKYISSFGDRFIFDSRPEEAQIHFSMLLYQIFSIGILFAFIAAIFKTLVKLWKNKSKESE